MNMNNSSYRVVTKSGHMAKSIVNSTMVHSIGSHALSFRDIDLEVGIKNVQKGQAWSIS